jgi:NAD(P)-dependent dehydrogenase (short-subunit alcohol dehydrogenase family)
MVTKVCAHAIRKEGCSMKKLSFDDLKGKVCVVTGGAGLIGKSLSESLASVGVRIAILDLEKNSTNAFAAKLSKTFGVKKLGLEANVLDRQSLEKAKLAINSELGKISLLINCAGGNSPRATTKLEYVEKQVDGNLQKTFYGLDLDGFRQVFDLNLLGTILPTMIFTADMIELGSGAVLNISSMNAFRPLTKIPAYSAAKASINNFTEWLAVHLAKVNIRVNAIAPGFLLTNQNRFLLTSQKSGNLNSRGKKILSCTPMGKFGSSKDLNGATLFLLSDLASFITGVVLPIDGGFNAYSGV